MKRIKSGEFPIRDLQTWEPAETLLPEYSRVQFKDLENFLKEGGQLPPIIISEDMRIIDGYNRWRMATNLGYSQIECDMYEYANEKEMELHAIVLNSKRRHLTSIQVARAAARLSDLFVEEEVKNQVTEIEPDIEEIPEDPQPETAELAFDDTEVPVEETPEVVAEPEVEVEVVSEVKVMPDVELKAVKDASKKLRISRQTVERVKQVDKTNDDQLINAMERKSVSLKQAAELAELPTEERHVELARIQAEKNEVDSSNSKVVLNACAACSSRLKSSFQKLNLAELDSEKKEEIKNSITEIIKEASDMLFTLDQPVAKPDSE